MRDKSEDEAWNVWLRFWDSIMEPIGNHGGFAGAEPCLRQENAREGALVGPFQTFSRFDKSWTQCIAILVSQFQCFHPQPQTNPTRAGIAFSGRSSSGTQRAVSGLEEMTGAASACSLKGSFEERGSP